MTLCCSQATKCHVACQCFCNLKKQVLLLIADWSNWPPARQSSQTLRPPSNRVTRSYLWAQETTKEPTSNILQSSFRASTQATIEVRWQKSSEAPPPNSSPPV